MTKINPTFMTLAQNYLTTKERTPHYEIRSLSDDNPAEGWCNLQSFTDEEMTQLLALREKYGKEEFFNHLNEIFDEDTLYDMVYGDEIIGFDLDSKFFKYTFTYHQITDKGVKTDSLKINLTDETYVKLLAMHLQDKGLNINKLKYADKSLYEIVTRGIDHHLCIDDTYMVSDPYTITMDEIKADAKNIREQHPEKFQNENGIIGYCIL